MSEKPYFRPARRDDSRAIAELYRFAAGGCADYIWTQMREPGESVLDVGSRRFAREDENYSYQKCVIAELDGKIVGMIHSYVIPELQMNTEPVDAILAPYAALDAEAPEGSLYISGIAFYQEYRGRGLGTKLIASARAQAHELGCAELCLMVFERNESAVRLYQHLGFRVAHRRAAVPHELIHYTGDVLLMVAPTG